MATTAELLGKRGPGGAAFTVCGIEFNLTRSTKDIQAEWSKWLVGRAEARTFDMSDKLLKRAVLAFRKADEISAKYEDVDFTSISPEENAKATAERNDLVMQGRMLQAQAEKLLERFNDRVAAGEFEYYGSVAIDLAQRDLPGQMMLVYLCLKPKHPDITYDDVVALHMPDEDGVNHIKDIRDALLKSEGVVKKKGLGSESPDSQTTKSETPSVP